MLSQVAHAQAPDSDQIFSPLIEQAERDQQANQPQLARARAQALLERVAVGSPLAGRAHLVINASGAATSSSSGALTADVIFEPLVTAAEADAVANRNALALARLSAAMSLVPADSPLAARARNLYALASRGSASATQAPAQAPPPQAQPAQVPSAQAPQQPQVIIVSPQTQAAPTPVIVQTQTTPTLAEAQARNAGQRHASEMAELRVAGGVLGVLGGVYMLTLLDADDPLLYVFLPLFTGVGFALATEALDAGNGTPTGVPAAVSAGMLAGFGDGLLIWGVARDGLDSTKSVLGVLLASTAVGGLVGGLFGYGARPTIAESRLIISGGAWGLWIGLMTAVAFDSNADKTWTSALIAYNVGLGSTMLMAGLGDVSMERVAFANGAMACGALVGLMVAGIAYGERNQRGKSSGSQFLGGSLAIGSSLGLLLGLALPEDDLKPGGSAAGVARALASADIDLAIGPMRGGVTFGLSGRL